MSEEKRGEPHDRQQGATDLRGSRRSKPSKSGRTARTERVRSVAAPGRWRTPSPRQARNPSGSSAVQGRREVRLFGAAPRQGEAGSGRQELMSMEGRSLDNPKRGVQIRSRPACREAARQAARRWTARAATSLQRRCEGHEGRAVWSTRPHGVHGQEVPRRQTPPARWQHAKEGALRRPAISDPYAHCRNHAVAQVTVAKTTPALNPPHNSQQAATALGQGPTARRARL